MRAVQVIVYLLLVSLNYGFCEAQEKEKNAGVLRLKWRVGELQHYRKTVKTKITGGEVEEEGEENGLEIESKETCYWTQKVMGVDDKGVATVRVQLTRFVSSQANNGGVLKLELDTDAFDKTKKPSGRHYFLRALLKIPITFKISQRGCVSSVTGLDSGVDKFLNGTKNVSAWEGNLYRNLWSNKRIEVIWNRVFQIFVDKKLTPKMTWKLGPFLSHNGICYLNEEKELTLQSLRLRKKERVAVVVGVGREAKKPVDKALNTRGKDRYSTSLRKGRSRLVLNVDKGVVEQLYETRAYTTDWIESGLSVVSMSCQETTTIQLRRNVKDAKR